MRTPLRSPGTWIWGLLLAAIVIAGAIARINGITFGLPFIYDIDEQDFVGLATTMLRNHDPNPHWFGHPGTTLLYLICATFGILFSLGRLTGRFADASAFEAAYFHDVSPFYIAARLLMVVLGLICVVLVYRIGERLFGKPTGALAAAFLALSPLEVDYSQHIRSDMVMTVFVLAAFWYCVRVVETGSRQSYLLAGAFIALATDSKYPAVLMVVPLVVAHFFSPAARDPRKLAWSLLAFALTSFAASPYLYLDYHQTIHDLKIENRPFEFGGVGSGPIGNALWYIAVPLRYALTVAGLLGVALGSAFLLRERRPTGILLLVTPLALLAFLSCLHLRWDRWTLPAVPFLALILAYGLTRLFTLDVGRLGRMLAAAGALVAAGIFASMIASDAQNGASLRGPDTRTLMAGYIIAHVPPNSALLSEIFTCQLPKARYRYFEVNEKT
ncbi:MAG TPA: glycosyltransferase family 39 protein, partial [Candidatus Baltobacteraceae bacterium]